MQPTVYSQTTELLNSKHIKFQINSNLLFVISDMGTGKSTQLKEILDQTLPVKGKLKQKLRFESVICLSFRITFTQEFKKKYNLTSYKDIKGPMDLQINPRMII
jgi:ABC-type ATPase involved in cell division